ncbi:hypothetical protein ACQ4PT_021534 [Festuca glaucescens]
MAVQKRPATVLGTTTKGSATSCKRSRNSTDEYGEVTRLGEGGFGVVLKARHRATGKTVAIKYHSSPDDNTEEGPDEAELRREARLLEACNGNPHVVGFEGSGNLCLVMEYVAAPSLHAFMWDRRHGPPLPEPEARTIMRKLLTGAKAMHARHVVHRDIKPASILVGRDAQLVKLCDLGLGISMSDPPPYTHVGTVPYKAPEMLLRKPDYDALVDAWSLGCVMAEMLAGETLFEDDGGQDHQDDADHVAQLWSIFRVLGMPDDRTWPEFKSLPLHHKVLQFKSLPLTHKALPEGQEHSRLRDIFPEEKLSEQGFQVLQGLLTYNPDKRLTAAKALKLPWFAAAPHSATAAKVEALPLPRKKVPRFMVPLAVLETSSFNSLHNRSDFVGTSVPAGQCTTQGIMDLYGDYLLGSGSYTSQVDTPAGSFRNSSNSTVQAPYMVQPVMRYADGADGMFDAEETNQEQLFVHHSYKRQSDNNISANASNGTNDSMFEDDDCNDDAYGKEQSFPNQFDSNSAGHNCSNISEEGNLTDEELDDVAPKYDIFGDDAPNGVDEVDDLVQDSGNLDNVEHLSQQDIQDFLDAEEAAATARSSSQEVRDHHAPRMGMAFDSDDAAHKFFNDYALLCGFAITKAGNYHAKKQGSTGHTRVTFWCNRSGKPVDEETLEAKRKQKQLKRQEKTGKIIAENSPKTSKRTQTTHVPPATQEIKSSTKSAAALMAFWDEKTNSFMMGL